MDKKTNKKAGIFILWIIILAGGYITIQNSNYLKNKQSENNVEPIDQVEVSNSEVKVENLEQAEDSFHSVSLPAYFDKQFNGTGLEMGTVLASNEFYTRYYITYQSGDLTISGIMNVPKGNGPFPVLILNHGYIDPAIYTNGRGLKREQDYFARQGYVVIHPDYRNHASSDKDETAEYELRLGYVDDVINAIMAVQNSDYDFFDKENIGMLGHSMGGGIAQNIAVIKPDLVKAMVLYAPVSMDQIDNFYKWLDSGERGKEIISRYGFPEDNPEFWENISALNFVDRISTPIQLHHGTADESVPLAWSEETVSALQTADKEITFYQYEDAPHEFINDWPLFMERSTDFFDQYLK